MIGLEISVEEEKVSLRTRLHRKIPSEYKHSYETHGCLFVPKPRITIGNLPESFLLALNAMSTNHPTTVISRAQLPNDGNVIFTDTSFFRDNGKHATLPSPATVREEAARPKTGIWAQRPFSVPFLSQNLVVKYGLRASISEAQCLWAIRHYLGHRVPVPEIYGWCQDGGEVFIYMQLVHGPRLNEAMENMERADLLHIMRQLRQIVLALRSLRQEPGESFLGKFNPWVSIEVT